MPGVPSDFDIPLAESPAADEWPGIDASAPPVRERGMRSRAGNAMNRTRAAVLDGAARAVTERGARKASMADIAAAAGIAKGTLYNHFRTKDAVFAAAVDAAVQELYDAAAKTLAEVDLPGALAGTARRISGSRVLARLRDEPDALLALLTISDEGVWALARARVAELLTDAPGGLPEPSRVPGSSVDLVLRWLVSHVPSPQLDDNVLGAEAARLAAAATAYRRVDGLADGAFASAGGTAGGATAVEGSAIEGTAVEQARGAGY